MFNESTGKPTELRSFDKDTGKIRLLQRFDEHGLQSQTLFNDGKALLLKSYRPDNTVATMRKYAADGKEEAFNAVVLKILSEKR